MPTELLCSSAAHRRRRALLSAMACLVFVLTAQPALATAAETPWRPGPPRFSIGAAVGVPEGFQAQGSWWLNRSLTAEAFVGSWLFVTGTGLSLTAHVAGDDLGLQALVGIRASALHTVFEGSSARLWATGVHAGVGWLGETVDVRLLAGAFVFGGMHWPTKVDRQVMPVVSLSVARLWRGPAP